MIRFAQSPIGTMSGLGANLPSVEDAHETNKDNKSTIHNVGLPVMTVKQIVRVDMDMGMIPVVMNMLMDEIDSQ